MSSGNVALNKVYNLDHIKNLINMYNAKIEKYSSADKDVDYKGLYGTFRLQPFSMDPKGTFVLPDVIHDRGQSSTKYDLESGMSMLKAVRALAQSTYNVKRCTNELETVIEDLKVLSEYQESHGHFGDPMRTQGNNEANAVCFAACGYYGACIVIYKEDSFRDSSKADIILETIDDPAHGIEQKEIGKVCDVNLDNPVEIAQAVQSFYHSFDLAYNEWNRGVELDKMFKEHPGMLDDLLAAESTREAQVDIDEQGYDDIPANMTDQSGYEL